ncbi:MAG: UDP-N-acetylmuramoyl-L-alanine--D-glutamate ligase, partial [Gallionellaceae bacterium]|nr:UDP-N-acetylmuramoyl-L-alanine--D-glutamate ligase [Gallionellaceae bacterium]
MTQLRNIRILVLGLGETGRSLLRWLDREGASIRAADSRDAPPSLEALRGQYPDVEFHCGAFNETLLDDIELIALSPGISLNEPVLREASTRDIPIVADI